MEIVGLLSYGILGALAGLGVSFLLKTFTKAFFGEGFYASAIGYAIFLIGTILTFGNFNHQLEYFGLTNAISSMSVSGVFF
jgi:hypothetical protein